LAHKEAAEDTAGTALLARVSPVAWQHINFYGRYEFTKGPAPIDVATIIRDLAQVSLVPDEDDS
jgi:hypothetical protein